MGAKEEDKREETVVIDGGDKGGGKGMDEERLDKGGRGKGD